MIYREAGVKRLDVKAFVYPAIGIALVVALAFLPQGLFGPQEGAGLLRDAAPACGRRDHRRGAGSAGNQCVPDALHAGDL